MGAALVLLTLAVYWPVRDFEFLTYDDDAYVTANSEVQQGLGAETFAWAFASDTLVASNWHPLTLLSHLADVSLYGLDPGWHHLTSLWLHAANVLALLALLRAASGSLWASAFVAALFALHPLNVQSVAWIAERKNVLSTLFWFASLGAYLAYARGGRTRWLVATGLALALGLLAKPMLVTLPCVLLLFDVWPLQRVAAVGWRRLLIEKLPLFALVAAASLLTLRAQAAGGAMIAAIPLGYRLINAAGAWLAYLGKLLWPHPLSFFYPHPASSTGSAEIAFAVVSLLVVAALTVTAWRRRRAAPWALLGWLWFLGTLVPVIGIVQVGDQALADRYVYVPAVGLFIVVAWGATALARRWGRGPRELAVAAALLLGALATVTRAELAPWRNSESLFRHALEENPDNYLAHTNLGHVLYGRGLKNQAMEQMEAAVRAKPGFALALANLGTLHAEAGELAEAERLLSVAVTMPPETARAHNALGAVVLQLGQLQRAERELRRALQLDPEFAPARANLERLAALRAGAGDEPAEDRAPADR